MELPPGVRERCLQLQEQVRREEGRRFNAFKDEKPALETLIASLTKTKEMMLAEKKRMQKELSAAAPSGGAEAGPPAGPAPVSEELARQLADYQAQVDDMNQQLARIDATVAEVKRDMAAAGAAGGGGVRPEEQELNSTKLVVLQDTRRLMQQELHELVTQMEQAQATARMKPSKPINAEQAAGQAVWEDLSRLEEQLTQADARLDKAKTQLYFPEVQGYKFTAGTAGVFIGAKDICISEVSGRVRLECAPATLKNGTRVARVQLAVGGASAGKHGGTAGEPLPQQADGTGPSSRAAAGAAVLRKGAAGGADGGPRASTRGRNNGGADTDAASPSGQGAGHQRRGSAGGSASDADLAVADDLAIFGARRPPRHKGAAVASFLSGLKKRLPKKQGRGPSASSGGAPPSAAALAAGAGATDAAAAAAAASVASPSSKLAAAVSNKAQSLGLTIMPGGSVIRAADDDSGEGSAHRRRLSFTGSESGIAIDGDSDDVDSIIGGADDQQDGEALAAALRQRGGGGGGGGASLATQRSGISSYSAASASSQSSSTAAAAAADLDLDGLDGCSSSSGGGGGGAATAVRTGVHVTLLAEQLGVLGEKGTRVPNMSVKEIAIEVEALLTATFEFEAHCGWQAPQRLTFTVTKLDHKARGNNVPLPRAVLKALLNAVMPRLLAKLCVNALLPRELGTYIIKSGEAIRLQAELKLSGPALSTHVADVAQPPPLPASAPTAASESAKARASQAAGARARQLLGNLTERQAACLHQLLASKHPACDPPLPCVSPRTLCDLYASLGASPSWPAIKAAFGDALTAIAAAAKLPDGERLDFGAFMEESVARVARKPLRIVCCLDVLEVGIDADCLLSAARDILERYAREFHEAVAAGRATTTASSAAGVGGPPARLEPLEVQLEGLNAGTAAISAWLQAFKSRFKSASAMLLASADSKDFHFGAEHCHYEGPLNVNIALPVALDCDNAASFDIRLPDPHQAAGNLAAALQDVLRRLRRAALDRAAGDTLSPYDAPTEVDDQVAAAAAAAAAVADGGTATADGCATPGAPASSSDGGGRRSDDDIHAVIAEWNKMVAGSSAASTPATSPVPKDQASAAAAAAAAAGQLPSSASTGNSSSSASAPMSQGLQRRNSGGGARRTQNDKTLGKLELPTLATPVVGQLIVRRLVAALKLDEARLAALLSGSTEGGGPLQAALVAQLLGCYGNLLSASLDMGWPPSAADGDVADDGGPAGPRFMLKLANNEVTRTRLDLESIVFQSCVSPKVAVRMLYAIVIALAHRFKKLQTRHMRLVDTVFRHVHEYVSKEVLDLLVCVAVRAFVTPDNKLKVAVAGGGGGPLAGWAAASSPAAQQQQQATAGGGGSDAAAGGGSGIAPVYLLNDVNLMTVMESVKLFMDIY